MQLKIFVLCVLLTVTKNVPGKLIPEQELYYIPLEDGTFKYVNTSELQVMLEKDNEHQKSDFEVKFWLFTRKNQEFGQQIKVFDQNALRSSHFNAKQPTRFIIHGWINDRDSPINQHVRKAYLNHGDYNVFVVDWGAGGGTISYPTAKNRVNTAGKKVAEFLDFLHTSGGMQFKTLYVIGHSLGAHVSGFAGKYVKKGKINTIIGLDPALPLFSINSPEGRLTKNDAEYVETIQTNGNKLGFYDPIGMASFYPNGGKSQVGCPVDATGTCSHSRSYEYFAESIGANNKFVATKCKNFDEIKKGVCTDGKKNLRMGGDPSNHGKANGIYYLETNTKKPFGKG